MTATAIGLLFGLVITVALAVALGWDKRNGVDGMRG